MMTRERVLENSAFKFSFLRPCRYNPSTLSCMTLPCQETARLVILHFICMSTISTGHTSNQPGENSKTGPYKILSFNKQARASPHSRPILSYRQEALHQGRVAIYHLLQEELPSSIGILLALGP